MFKSVKSCPSQFGSVIRASAHELKGPRFKSSQGNIAQLQAPVPALVRASVGGNQGCLSLTLMFLSVSSLSPSIPSRSQREMYPTVRINKQASRVTKRMTAPIYNCRKTDVWIHGKLLIKM